MAAPDYSSVYGSIDKNAAYQKQQASQGENANRQNQQDALQRRSAQLGGGPGGALINSEQQINNQSAQRLNQANQGIDAQTDQAKQGIQMTQIGQQFQTSEREAGQQFAQGQQQAAFSQQTSLQNAQITAQQIMQDKGISAQSSLQDRQIAAQELMQKTGIDAQSAQQLVGIQAQKDLQQGQQNFQKPFMEAQETGMYNGQQTEQAQVDQFNEKIASQMANKKDILEQAFGNFSTGSLGGFLGGLTNWANPNTGAGQTTWDPGQWKF